MKKFYAVFFLSLFFIAKIFAQVNPPVISYTGPLTLTSGISGSIVPTNTGGAVPATVYLQATSLAGTTGTAGNTNGTGTAASFKSPYGTATDASGNIYVADAGNNLIRKITPAGVVTTFAGSGTYGSANGTGSAATFSSPRGVAVDATGNVYVADQGSNKIRKITSAGVVTTLAGSGTAGAANGTGTAATFSSPYGVVVDASGNVYVADYTNNLIRKITSAGLVTTLAGSGTAGNTNGTGIAASFKTPRSVTTDNSGNIYVADYGNNLIRKIAPNNIVTTLAGSGTTGHTDGTGTGASFGAPASITIDSSGNLYVSDVAYNLIRKVTSAGVVTTLAGTGSAGSVNGTGTTSSFSSPTGVNVDALGNLYIADSGNQLIRKITLAGYTISPALPTGLAFTQTTGMISGTPTAASPSTNYTITAYNAGGSGSTILNITVNNPVAPPNISYVSPQNYTTGTAITSLSPTNTGGMIPATPYGRVSTYAGSTSAGSADGTGSAAGLSDPFGVVSDAAGNIYVSDMNNNLIRKIAPGGVVTTLAGTGSAGNANGTGTAASFNAPRGIAVDASGNIYVVDRNNNLIRKITSAGVVTTLAGSGSTGSADGTGTAASFSFPVGITVDPSGNIYVGDTHNNEIRKITPAGVVTTFAGSTTAGLADGTGTAAGFSFPEGISSDMAGNIYVADIRNNEIRKITPAGVVTTIAGSPTAGAANGTGAAASFSSPYDVAVDAAGNLYVADNSNALIRKISPTGVVTTLAGSGNFASNDGSGTTASFAAPTGVAVDPQGNVYVADGGNNEIREIVNTGYGITPGLSAGLTLDPATGIVSGTPTVANPATSYSITAYNSGGSSSAIVNITVLKGPPIISYAGPLTLTAGISGSITPTNTGSAVPAVIYTQSTTLAGSGTAGNINGTGTGASFKTPFGTATDASGNIYVADAGNNLIRMITPAGVVTTLAGSGSYGSANGTGTAATFSSPRSVAVDATGNVYVADQGSNKIRKITSAGVVTTLAGSGIAGATNGTGTAATFSSPYGVAVDLSGNVYVADYTNNLIRAITPAGIVTTLAGSGTAGKTNGTGASASFKTPRGVTADALGNIYVADYGNNLIRKITPAGVVTTLAGSGVAGHADGTGTAATFSSPSGVAVDIAGDVFVTDYNNFTIRKITSAGIVTTVAGTGSSGAVNGIGTGSSFNGLNGLALDANNNLYIADSGNQLIRKITLGGYTISPALTGGLTFDGTTGIISGVPTAASPATSYSITAYNSGGSGSTTLNITVSNSVAAPNIAYAGPQTYGTNNAITPLAPTNSGGAIPASQLTVSILAGNGTGNSVNGTGTAASFSEPSGVTTDASGNVYVADAFNNLIRKITPAGVVTTFAGSGTAASVDGTGTAASFNQPTGVVTDASGILYVAESGSNLVRKITPAGVVTTFATLSGFLTQITIDAKGSLYVADGSSSIQKITPAGVVSTFASGFYSPFGVTVDATGNVYVSDFSNRIFKVSSDGNTINTLAGSGAMGNANGTGTAASFNNPNNLTVDAAGNVYVTDTNNNLIRKITPAGVVTTFAGSGAYGSANGLSSTASFAGPFGITVGKNGNFYVSDQEDDLIRKIGLSGYSVSPALPAGLNLDPATGTISGTPTVKSPATAYTITAYNAGGISSATVNITVLLGAPVISYTGPLTLTSGISGSIVPTNTGGAVPATIYLQATTLAGTAGTAGATNGTGTAASFKSPFGTATDASGNIYVADAGNNLIRKITPAGVVTTFAGSGTYGSANGTGAAATFSSPRGVAVDAAGNVYVADQGSNKIRKITSAGVVTTLAGSGTAGAANGTGGAATFSSPYGVAVDASGNVYVADYTNNLIREITPTGVVTTLAGSGTAGATNGTGAAASFKTPRSVAVDASGNVYVADYGNNLIRKITQAGVVTTLAGSGTAGHTDGTGTAASFGAPAGITADALGNLYVSDIVYNLIRKVTPNGIVTTLAGTNTAGAINGTGTGSSFSGPNGISIDAAGTLYIADSGNQLIRKITLAGYTISPALPTGLAFTPTTGTIGGTPTAASPSTNYTITAYNAGGSGSTILNITVNNPVAPPNISYASPQNYAADSTITPLVPKNTGGVVSGGQLTVSIVAGNGAPTSVNGTGTGASFNQPAGMTVDQAGNIYLVEPFGNLIRKITPTGVTTTFAGSGAAGSVNGTGTAASFNSPSGIVIDPSGNLYVSESGSNLVRKITPAGVVTTFATLSGFLTQIAIDASGNLYVADGSASIIKITSAGTTSTFATGFNGPFGVAVDAAGNVYVSDFSNKIFKVSPNGSTITTFAGSGAAGNTNGTGTAASFNNPNNIAVDAAGNVYVADSNNNLIRKITPAGVVTTYAGSGAYGSANGAVASASFSFPFGVATDNAGNLYVSDDGQNLIRKIGLSGFTVSPILPAGLTMDPNTGIISGTPTVIKKVAINYTITAYNAGGTGIASLTITIDSLIPHSLPRKTIDSVPGLDRNIALWSANEPTVRQAVSPNGDGINDVLMIDGIENYPDNKVTLIDRSGKPVYEVSGYDNANKMFDGHSNINRTMQQAGTYFYLLEYHTAKGELKRKTGYFILKY